MSDTVRFLVACAVLQEAGLPIGGGNFNPYVMLEVHYNNPKLKKGEDSSRYEINISLLVSCTVGLSTFGLFWKSYAVGVFSHDFKHAEFSGRQKVIFEYI